MRDRDRYLGVHGFVAGCVSVAEIKKAVAERFGVPEESMTSATRKRSLARPRQIAMHLSRKLTPFSYPRIGAFFGDRDHTTVLHAVRHIERLMGEDHNFKDTVTTLRGELVSAASTKNGGSLENGTCMLNRAEPLEYSMKHLQQISDPSTRKTIIMSKWERGELRPSEAMYLIRKLGLEAA